MTLTAQNKKYLGIGFLVFAIIAVIIYLNRDRPVIKSTLDKIKKPVTKDSNTTTDEAFKVKDAPPVVNDSFPLKTGSRGERVKTLQLALNRLKPSPLLPIVVDGEFGDKTKSAVLSWAGAKYYGASGITENLFNELVAKSNAEKPGVTYQPAPTY